jgi:hypothetical protein
VRAELPMITLKRGAVLAAPAAVPASMALVFRWLFSPAFATGGVQRGLHHLLAGRVHRLSHGGPRPSPSSPTADTRSSTIGCGDVVVDLACGWRGEQRVATESQQDRRDACRGDGDNRGDQRYGGGAVMARRLSPRVPSRSAAGAAVAACWVLSLASNTTDDLAFSVGPLAVHAGCGSGRLGIGV